MYSYARCLQIAEKSYTSNPYKYDRARASIRRLCDRGWCLSLIDYFVCYNRTCTKYFFLEIVIMMCRINKLVRYYQHLKLVSVMSL